MVRPVPDVLPETIDWKVVRDRIDLVEVITRETGTPPVVKGGRPWWVCPFHEDRNPSLVVRRSDQGRVYFCCYGCGASGDAVDFVRRLRPEFTFPDAVAYLEGGQPGRVPAGLSRRPTAVPPARPPDTRPGLSERDAEEVVARAVDWLWTPRGAERLAYLRGFPDPDSPSRRAGRCLSDQTIRDVRLGFTAGLWVPARTSCRFFRTAGWVIPWFDGDRLAVVKVRQPDGNHPKYVEVYRNPDLLAVYPSPGSIAPGLPLVVAEGEFDALVLRESLEGRASAVTLGGASCTWTLPVSGVMLRAPRWYIASDADPAGDRAADRLPGRARRVRPPHPHKDWTEARQAGVDLRGWWADVLAGGDEPRVCFSNASVIPPPGGTGDEPAAVVPGGPRTQKASPTPAADRRPVER